MEDQKPQEPVKAFFWMASVDIIYTVENGLPRIRPVNVLAKTFNPFVNQITIGNMQKSAQVQAMEYKKIPRKAKIEDVIVNGPWMIGHMTDQEFLQAQPSQTFVADNAGGPGNEEASAS